MPNRWIKEQYRSSERINAASPRVRDFWVRLLVTCDDHGRFHGDPRLIASACYPLDPSANSCTQMLAELCEVKLGRLYTVEGKVYLQLLQWYERPRSNSKFPEPLPAISESSNVINLLADASKCEQVRTSTSTSTSTSTVTASNEKISFAAGALHGISDDLKAIWRKAYPAIDLDLEINKAAAWLVSNPNNRKSRYDRFLNGWFDRAQNKAPAQGGGPARRSAGVVL